MLIEIHPTKQNQTITVKVDNTAAFSSPLMWLALRRSLDRSFSGQPQHAVISNGRQCAEMCCSPSETAGQAEQGRQPVHHLCQAHLTSA